MKNIDFYCLQFGIFICLPLLLRANYEERTISSNETVILNELNIITLQSDQEFGIKTKEKDFTFFGKYFDITNET